MSLTEQTDHVTQATALLLTQFKGAAAVEAWLSSYVTQVQEIEAMLFDLLEDRAIDTAIGTQLDGLGVIVGVAREALSDDDYRERLKIQVKINACSGTIEDVLEIFKLLMPDNTFFMTEYADAAFTLEVVEPILNGPYLARVCLLIKAAGVRLLLFWADASTGDDFFSFGPDPDLEGDSFGLDSTGGFIASSE